MGRALVNKTLKDLMKLILPEYQAEMRKSIREANSKSFKGKQNAKRELLIGSHFTTDGKKIDVLISKKGSR